MAGSVEPQCSEVRVDESPDWAVREGGRITPHNGCCVASDGSEERNLAVGADRSIRKIGQKADTFCVSRAARVTYLQSPSRNALLATAE